MANQLSCATASAGAVIRGVTAELFVQIQANKLFRFAKFTFVVVKHSGPDCIRRNRTASDYLCMHSDRRRIEAKSQSSK